MIYCLPHNRAVLGPGVGQKQGKVDRYYLTSDSNTLTNLASRVWLLSKAKGMILSIIRRFSISRVEPCQAVKWHREHADSLLCSWPHYAASVPNMPPLKINSYSSNCLSLAWCNYLPKVMNGMIGSQQKEHDVKMGFSSISLFLGLTLPGLLLPLNTHVSSWPTSWCASEREGPFLGTIRALWCPTGFCVTRWVAMVWEGIMIDPGFLTKY